MKKNILFILPILIIMSIIFYSSSQTYEEQTIVPTLDKKVPDKLSKGILGKISFTYAGSEISIDTKGSSGFIEFVIRKTAHFVIFGFLSLFSCIFLKRFFSIRKAILFSILISSCYAISDEFHQGLTGGRSPMYQDVILDTLGAIFFVLIFHLSVKYYKKIKTSNI